MKSFLKSVKTIFLITITLALAFCIMLFVLKCCSRIEDDKTPINSDGEVVVSDGESDSEKPIVETESTTEDETTLPETELVTKEEETTEIVTEESNENVIDSIRYTTAYIFYGSNDVEVISIYKVVDKGTAWLLYSNNGYIYNVEKVNVVLTGNKAN